MRTMYHILQDVSWEDIEPIAKQIGEHPSSYLKIFRILKSRNPVPNTEHVRVHVSKSGEVQAFSNDKLYSTQSSLYNQWLGYVVEYPKELSKAEVVVYLIKEIIDNQIKLSKSISQLSADFDKLLR